MKRLLISVGLAALGVAGCGSSSHTSGGSSSGTSLDIKNFSFKPQTDTIKVGTKLTWTQQDATTHTVTDTGVFNSGDLTQGKTFSYTFTKAGTYSYICSIHNYMTGTIIVQ